MFEGTKSQSHISTIPLLRSTLITKYHKSLVGTTGSLGNIWNTKTSEIANKNFPEHHWPGLFTQLFPHLTSILLLLKPEFIISYLLGNLPELQCLFSSIWKFSWQWKVNSMVPNEACTLVMVTHLTTRTPIVIYFSHTGERATEERSR